MKQGETTESQVKSEIHEQMTNIKKRWSLEFSGNWKRRSSGVFWKWKTLEILEFPEIE